MRLIFDGNSLLNQALLRGTDHDQGRVVVDAEGKKHQVNSADYGVDGFFEKYADALKHFGVAPRSTVVVWDGRSAKARRQNVLARYKAGRDKIPEVNEQLNAARERVTKMVRDLGATVMLQDLVEADDVIGYLVKRLRDQPNTIVSADGDLAVLVDENTNIWRLGELNVNPCGPIPFKHITLYKAIVGDNTDKIPGAPGFGEGAWIDLVATFGVDGLDMLEELVVEGQLDRLKEDLADFPRLEKIIKGKESVTQSWYCAKLHVDEINTLRREVQILPGMVKQWEDVSVDERVTELRQYYGTSTLVHAGNYAEAYKRFGSAVGRSPFVALDIETSSTDDSDEWLEAVQVALKKDSNRLDGLGHELTGMALTFGENAQHTIYMTVDHVETEQHGNITVDQCREMCEQIPKRMFTVIQNRAFEFQVLYRTWGEKWKDNGWRGMVPNAIDTKIGASYVNENMPLGLKQRSLHHLGYQQTSYEQTTQRRAPVGQLSGGSVKEVYKVELEPAVTEQVTSKSGKVSTKVITPAVTQDWELREYKMNQLTAKDVFAYGCDDTICTAALHTYYHLVMLIEGSWEAYLKVEQRPEYLTSLAHVQGVPFNLMRLRDFERKDDATYAAAWVTLRDYLLTKGWAGTVRPEVVAPVEPADVKVVCEALLGDFSTRKRKLDAIAADIRAQYPDNDIAGLLAMAVERGDADGINSLLAAHFTGEPKINFGSAPQMQNLFYRVLGVTPRIINAMTEKQREHDEVMGSAFRKWRKRKDGKAVEFTAEEWDSLLSKTSTDDDAVTLALARDTLGDAERKALKAYQAIKTITTRRSLFYKTYKALPHWRDGLIHSSMNQCQAVTRRYSSSAPNLQQQDDIIRMTLDPHHPDAVVVSIDWTGQELRLMAEYSGDEALTSCYVGDNLRDVHSLTAVAASIYLWDAQVSYDDFQVMRKSPDPEVRARANDLRQNGKTTNFGTQYGLMAQNLSIKLLVDPEVAQQFIDAKAKAFPGIDRWKDEVESEAARTGFAVTMLGARRHLRESLLSDNKWERMRAARQASNHCIQGSGSEMAKIAMGDIWEADIFTGRFDARFYAPVHDELVFSVRKDQAIDVIREVHGFMTQPYADMKIPIVASISLGRTYGEQIETGEEFDPVAIQKALDEIFQKEAVAA